MKFFKAKDFPSVEFPMSDRVAYEANAKIEREGLPVYAKDLAGGYIWASIQDATHKALLINIEPIAACAHPMEKVESYYAEACKPETKYFKCKCGVKVSPTGFVEVR